MKQMLLCLSCFCIAIAVGWFCVCIFFVVFFFSMYVHNTLASLLKSFSTPSSNSLPHCLENC